MNTEPINEKEFLDLLQEIDKMINDDEQLETRDNIEIENINTLFAEPKTFEKEPLIIKKEKLEIEPEPIIIKQSQDIIEEEKIKKNFELLKSNYNIYLEVLKSFKVKKSFDLNKVLENYTEKVFEKIFKSDPLAQLELKASLDPIQYKANYIKNKGLNKNEKIEKAWLDLLKCFTNLGLEMNDNFILTIDYFTFEGSVFQKFINEDVWEFITKYENWIDHFGGSNIRNMLNNKMFLVNQSFYNTCYEAMKAGNTDFFKIVKTEEYKIN